jgi:hypothetical protein
MHRARTPSRLGALTAAAASAAWGLLGAPPVAAQAPPGGAPSIYSCVDDRGHILTSDRPIPECVGKGKPQRRINPDGSTHDIVPPTLTAEERAREDARQQAAADARAAQADAVRRDRNLLARYPDEPSHLRARQAALDPVRLAIKNSELRLRELANERKPLQEEAQFYVGKPLPPKLKSALDANDAAVEAQHASEVTQQAELDRVNSLYDAELVRLRRLWAGAPAGSLGPLAGGGLTGSNPAASVKQ